MKSSLFAFTLIIFGYFVTAPASAYGPLDPLATATWSYRIYGGDANTGHGIDQSDGATFQDPSDAFTPAGDILGTYDSNAGIAGTFAYADVLHGKIGVRAEASATSQRGANLVTQATAEAGYQDAVTFQGATSSGRLTVIGYLRLEGSTQADTGGRLFYDALSGATISVTGIGFNSVNASSSSSDQSLQQGNDTVLKETDSSTLPPKEIEFRYRTIVGVPFAIMFKMSASASAQANSVRGLPDGITNFASASSNFARTLSWGGITSVIDTDTGEAVNDWTVSSASGFDYTKVAPEPSSFVLLASALGGLALARKRLCLTRAKQYSRLTPPASN